MILCNTFSIFAMYPAGSTFFVAFLGVLAAMATLSSKAAGLLWLLLVFYALVQGGRRAWADKDGFTPAFQQSVTLTWLGLTVLALALRAVAMLHWGDSWQERHAELRLLLGAAAVWVWLRFGRQEERSLSWLNTLAYGFAVACVLGLGRVAWMGREHLTTHPIAWAVGVSLLSIWLLHSALWLAQSKAEKWVWLGGGLCGVLAVLTSQSRGAFGVVLWWAALGMWHLWASADPKALARKVLLWGLLLAAIATVGVTTGLLNRPVHVLEQAVTEYEATENNTKGAESTSFGARLYMWQRSLGAVATSPIWGYGQAGRKELIDQWGREADSTLVQSLGHAHNQYLNDWLDGGVFGLTSGLVYVLGLAGLAAWLLAKGRLFAGWTLGGSVFMHATAGLSNVNFAHNYYSIVLSLVVGVSLANTHIPLIGANNR